ncbi:MAG: cytochrome c [Phycisphaerales bacterium]|nr:cytochrome c [Phycisphaerales bacterium]
MRPGRCCAVALVLIAGAMGGCSTSDEARGPGGAAAQARPAVEAPTMADAAPRDYPGIHNAVAYHEGFLSGSVPEGDAGFDTLAAMGVRTIISVDGAEPEVGRARARGMRYIHLPIGYNGIDEQRKLELVRATRDAMRDGPVYIHCHHGKHRSAGAAAAVAASLGWDTPEGAVARMKVSGTAPNYTGLYACAASARVLAASAIDAVAAEFPEVSRPSGFVKGMVEADEIMEHLKAIERAGWRAPADHPDLVPVAEAARLADLLRVLAEGDRARGEPAEFAALMRESGERAAALEEGLAVEGVPDGAELTRRFKVVAASCKDCHSKHRD